VRFGKASMKGRQAIKIEQRHGYTANPLPSSVQSMHDSMIVTDGYRLDDLMTLDLSGFLVDTAFLNEGDAQNSQSDGFQQIYPVFDDEIIWHDGGPGASKTSNSTAIGINGEGSTTRSVLNFSNCTLAFSHIIG
jgi:hypothetical protein